jgi:hypothetical protein
MPSPSEELQKAIYDALLADAAVSALVADRVYDGAPESPEMPYITFGPSDHYEHDAQCITARVETLQLDCWARDGGRLRPAKALADAVKSALHDADLSLDSHALVRIQAGSVRTFLDRDGETAHGVVSIEAAVEESYRDL